MCTDNCIEFWERIETIQNHYQISESSEMIFEEIERREEYQADCT